MPYEINGVFLILAGITLALLMTVFIVVFFYVTQKRSIKYTENLERIKKEYETAFLNAQIEIQANTLQEVSDEIHDNIGQKLSFAKMNLGGLSESIPIERQLLFEETKVIISEIIGELRHISKSISPRHIKDFGLVQAIGYQIERINKSGTISAGFSLIGENRIYDPQIEIVLFRIVQELMNNVVKHSECSNILVSVNFENEKISIIVKDDGKGFDRNNIMNGATFKDGTGLYSIQNKAKSISCSIAFNSNNNGTIVSLVKNFAYEQN